MLLHATGFHGRCWLPVAPALTGHFSVWAIDQRGHGCSGKAPDGRYDDWGLFVDDFFSVLEALGLGGWRGFGHSLGGAVLLAAEQQQAGTFARLCVYEPVVITRELGEDGFRSSRYLNDLARKRRNSFGSLRDARDNFAAKPPMDRFAPEALDAYVAYGLTEDRAGGVVLACAPEDEASVYRGATQTTIWEHLPDVRPPVTVLGGVDERDPVSRAVEAVASRLPRGRAHRLPGLNHFGPFQDPLGVGRQAAQALRDEVDEAPDGQSSTSVPPPR
jgi:pimeloyl-ACP methyl ester carboxylesterase